MSTELDLRDLARDTNADPNLEYKTIEQLAQLTRLDQLSPPLTLKLHLAQIISAKNENRAMIHDGALKNLSLRTAFNKLHQNYLGDNPISFMIAHYLWSGSNILTSLWFQQLNHTNQIYITLDNFLKFRQGTEEEGIRTQPVGSDEDGVFPSPDALPGLATAFFEKVESFVTDRDLYTDIQKYQFSVFAARVLIRLHIKIDLNGRAVEDWMVELQRRLFNLDTITPENQNQIKTWGRSGLVSEQSEFSEFDHLQQVLTREGLNQKDIFENSNRVRRHSMGRNIFNRTFQKKIDNEKRIGQLIASSEADSADAFFSNLIENLTQPDTWNEFGIPELTQELLDFCNTSPYEYTNKTPGEIIEISDEEKKQIEDVTAVYKRILKKNQDAFELNTLRTIRDELGVYLTTQREARKKKLLEKSASGLITDSQAFQSKTDIFLFIKFILSEHGERLKKTDPNKVLLFCQNISTLIGLNSLTIFDSPNREQSIARRVLLNKIKSGDRPDSQEIEEFLDLVTRYLSSNWFFSEQIQEISETDYHQIGSDDISSALNIVAGFLEADQNTVDASTAFKSFVKKKTDMRKKYLRELISLLEESKNDPENTVEQGSQISIIMSKINLLISQQK